VIFNEKVLYKDRSSVETDMVDSDTSPQKSEFIRLEGLPDVTEQNRNQESLQEDSSTYVPTTTQADAEPSEPTIYVRRSSKTVKPPQPLLLNPARRVDPGPGRPGGWTGPDLTKDRLWQQPGQTRATRANPDETRFFFFFKCGI
jgi:cell division protein FtsN